MYLKQLNMMAGAFTGGSGDYVTLFEPTATELELSGEGFVLASVGEESGEIPYTAFFATQSYMDENKEIISRFVSAVSKGLDWVQNHDAAEVAKIIQPQFPDTSTKVLSEVVERYRSIDAWNNSLVMKSESFDRLQDVMEEAGELQQRVPFETIVDNTMASSVSQ
ncbi:ABC transporter substrate-binding protein [Butyrivibrio sp. JL13D10]|uniref:ABC transporter substrate-binding protein n=1 Tax=Butyrivibrio sp. JL13D10 TaxID=3236815 RepID=UPI0038B4D298